MKLVRCKDQPRETLEQFYADQELASIGLCMIPLIERLRAHPDERAVWGLTSHAHLVLLSADTYKSPWYVRFCGMGKWYQIDYLMPERLAPWPGARVTAEAHSQDTAFQMILQAMELSEGWHPDTWLNIPASSTVQ
jgi:hypothetical protein